MKNKIYLLVLIVLNIFIIRDCKKDEKILPIFQKMEVINENDELPLSLNRVNGYYVSSKTNLIIAIRIFNPDKCEILSIVINGEKYQKYQFQTNSDVENIFIRIPLDKDKGKYELILEEIKYIQDTNISIIPLNEEKSITVYITNNNPLQFNKTTTITYNSYILDYQIDNLSMEDDYYINLKILDNEKIVIDLILTELKDTVTINNLKQNKNYVINVECKYDDYSSNEYQYVNLLLEEFTLLSNCKIENIVSSETTIDCILDCVDCVDLKSYLYCNDELVAESSDCHFSDLQSNTQYKIIISYKYQTIENEIIEYIETKNYDSPTLSFSYKSYPKKIEFEYKINIHKDLIFEIEGIYLHKDNELIKINNDECVIDNLEEETLYKIEFIIIYYENINEKKTIRIEESFSTTKQLTIKSIEVLNSEMMNDEDDLIIKIVFLEDISLIKLMSIEFNDYQITDNCINYYDEKTVIVLFPAKYKKDNKLVLEKIGININGLNLFSDYKNEITFDTEEQIKIEDVSFTNNSRIFTINNSRIYDENNNDIVLIKLSGLNNAIISDVNMTFINNYNEEVNNNIESLFEYDDNVIAFNINSVYKTIHGLSQIVVNSLIYEDDTKIKTVFCLNAYNFFEVDNFDVIEVSTPKEFQNMNSKRIYSIKNNIDMSGIKWEMHDFNGIVYGNKYTISNIKLSMNEYEHIGLFDNLNGIIMDLNIKNIFFDSSEDDNMSREKSMIVGLLAVRILHSHIENLLLEGIFLLDVSTGYIGGICDYSFYSFFNNINLNLKAYIKINNGCFSGIVNSPLKSNYKNIINNSNIIIDHLINEDKYYYFGVNSIYANGIEDEDNVFTKCEEAFIKYNKITN